jgi:hypothetical protein
VFCFLCLVGWLFSSPELKAQVNFSDRPSSVCPSVCKLLHIQRLL